jgi:glycosyltransferase involved in cell wall biosynthesis
MKPFLNFDYNKFNQKNLNKILSKFGDPKKLRVLYISTYDPNYTRTETLLGLFKTNKINHRTILPGKGKYLQAIKQLIKNKKDYDVIFVGFRGQELLPFIRLFTKKPIIFDSFLSLYDTLCFDRKVFKPKSFLGRFLKSYEIFLCKISNTVLVDTKTHKDYFEKEFNKKNIDYLYVGCNTKIFKPTKIQENKSEKIVFWYGYANPLQGVDVILKSAKILEKNKKIKFKLVGPIKGKYSNLIKKLQLKNMEFIDFIPYNKLPNEINKADICLGGHFSNKDKAKRVIAGKTFQFLACNKPTIIGDNSANRELFKDKGIIHFVKMNNEKALANKILGVMK